MNKIDKMDLFLPNSYLTNISFTFSKESIGLPVYNLPQELIIPPLFGVSFILERE